MKRSTRRRRSTSVVVYHVGECRSEVCASRKICDCHKTLPCLSNQHNLVMSNVITGLSNRCGLKVVGVLVTGASGVFSDFDRVLPW